VGVCAAEEGGEVVVGGEVAVVDEVLAGVLGVVGPCLRRQPPHQAQHLTVGAQPRVGHRLRQCVYVGGVPEEEEARAADCCGYALSSKHKHKHGASSHPPEPPLPNFVDLKPLFQEFCTLGFRNAMEKHKEQFLCGSGLRSDADFIWS